jgi:hypothetical protein
MSKPVFIALRKTNAPGFLPGVFSRLVRARLITRYPHAGIVVGGRLLHITAKEGMHSTNLHDPHNWDLFRVDVDPLLVLERFNGLIGCKYDWISLLAFVLPWRVSVSHWLYCYEWVSYALTGELPGRRVTPEDLLTFSKGKDGNKQ